MLFSAYNYAEQMHANQKRASGEPYFTHPCAVAEILIDLGLDAPTVAAAFLHDVIEDTPATKDDITPASATRYTPSSTASPSSTRSTTRRTKRRT